MDLKNFKWTREPEDCRIESDKIEIVTKPYTDLWQRTYYHFQNDNAPVFQMETDEKFFSFVVKTEYENEEYQHLGSVVTNQGYSDWATTVIDASVKFMWYRFSRREDEYCIECSTDGINFRQMRICHMHKGRGKISFGIYGQALL